ncbi:MAG: hypothetical protein ACYCX3_12595 [Thermoleophilia bacterium]
MQRRRELGEYALALNEVREPFGRSLYWTIGRLTQLNEAPASDAYIQLSGDFDETQDITAAIDRALAESDVAKTSQRSDIDGSASRTSAAGGSPGDAAFTESAPQVPLPSVSELGMSTQSDATVMVDSEGGRIFALLRSSREPLSAREICKALSAQGHEGFDKSLVNSWLYRWKVDGLVGTDASYCWRVL